MSVACQASYAPLQSVVPLHIPTPKSRGTTIAIHKSCPFQPIDSRVDPLGRYVFLKGTIAGHTYTFVSIYTPSTNQLGFLDSTLERLGEFREGFLILGGDYNVSPDPLLDTSHARPPHSYAFLKHFRKSLQSLLLTYSWQLLHPLTGTLATILRCTMSILALTIYTWTVILWSFCGLRLLVLSPFLTTHQYRCLCSAFRFALSLEVAA